MSDKLAGSGSSGQDRTSTPGAAYDTILFIYPDLIPGFQTINIPRRVATAHRGYSIGFCAIYPVGMIQVTMKVNSILNSFTF